MSTIRRATVLVTLLLGCHHGGPHDQRPGDRGLAEPNIREAPSPTCPGTLSGVVCAIYLTPRCGPDEHVRVDNCRPFCVLTAPCLEEPSPTAVTPP